LLVNHPSILRANATNTPVGDFAAALHAWSTLHSRSDVSMTMPFGHPRSVFRRLPQARWTLEAGTREAGLNGVIVSKRNLTLTKICVSFPIHVMSMTPYDLL
jgi:hypothetical protein